MRRHRAVTGGHQGLSPEARFKANQRSKTKVYIQRGKIVRQPCQIEGCTEMAHPHHVDYEDFRNVQWLCTTHHLQRHGKIAWKTAFSFVP